MDSYDSSAELIFGSSGPWDKTFWTFRFDSGVTRHGKFERSYRLVLYTLIRVSVGGGEPAQAWLQLLRMGRHVSMEQVPCVVDLLHRRLIQDMPFAQTCLHKLVPCRAHGGRAA